MSAAEEVHSDTDDDGYYGHSPSPAFSPSRPPGDDSSHIDTDSSADSFSANEHQDVNSDDEDSRHGKKRIPERVGNFRLLAKHKIDVAPYPRVAKWVSEKSGLKVVWADTPDLITSFSATVVTEIFNSSGEPHTLEHLTFTASEHYPYSNVLDAIAGRLMTQGVNAATDTDNTTYTVESASAEGMLEIIPVYLDHILFPLMTPEIFKTEIYHINGKGEEGGTVFSEMQGREGNQADVMALAQQQALYQFKNAYRYETGGMLPHLRNLTLQKIEDYHKTAYVPQNLTVVVLGGSLDPEKLLDTISQTTERHIAAAGLARGEHPQDWIRPFVESDSSFYDPIIEKDKTITVPYADTDTSTGQIIINWVGPRAHDWLTTAALGVLGDYLTGSAHSVLRRKFVEIPEPACAGISFDVVFRDPTIVSLDFAAVQKGWLSTLADDVRMVLKCLCRVPVDMKAMKLVLKNQLIALEQTMESKPGVYIQTGVMQDIIYGKENGSQLKDAFSDLAMLKKLSKWTEEDWVDLMKEYLLERHFITLIGTPTPELVKEHSEKDAARLARTVRKFGPEGLARLERDLERAEKTNDHPPPPSFVEGYPVPDFKKLEWLKVDTGRSNGVGGGRGKFTGKVQRIINSDGPDLPFFVQFDHITSEFVTVSLFLHGPALPILPLYLNTFFSMPINQADGHQLSWQDVSRKLDEDLTGYSATIEHEGIRITVTAIKEDYANAISWLSDVVFGTVFDVERLKNLVNKQLQVFSMLKQDGSGIADAAAAEMVYSKASLETPTNPIHQLSYYPKLKQCLDQDPQVVIKELEKMRKSLIDPRWMRFGVVGDIYEFENPSSTWLDAFEPVKAFPVGELAPVLRQRDLLTPLGSRPAKEAVIYRIDNSESSYLAARARCPDWTHPDFAAVEVATTILSQTNGLLWQVTRTAGLCYGSSIENLPEHGTLSLKIYRAPDAIAALAAIRKVLASVIAGKTDISRTDLEAAKSQIAFATVEDQRTPDDAASSSFFNTVILSKPANFAQQLLSQIERVTVDDVHRVIDTWIAPLCDCKTSIVGGTTSPNGLASLSAGLTKLGYHVEERHF
ncbi:hypothetical protein JCM5353_004086 [Sporobolomyces roseus]